MNTTKMATIALAIVIALPAFSLLANAQEDDGGNSFTITTEEGSIDSPGTFGGGDYFHVKFGRDRFGLDTLFGIRWGTEENLNTISIVTMQARYLGMAHITGEAGGTTQRPLKVYTLHTVRLGSIIEFDDVNGDGLAGYIRPHPEDEGGNISTVDADIFYNKQVSMTGAWTAASPEFEMDPDTGERHWTLTLTADNLTYKKIHPMGPWSAGDENITTEKMEKVQFTFHLTARVEEVAGITVPQYGISVEQTNLYPDRNWKINSMEKMDPVINASGEKGVYEVKWDHQFLGWDFNQNNQNPRLLLETRSFLGNHVPPAMAQWMQQNQDELLERMGESGHAQYEHQNGTENDNGTSSGAQRPKLLRQNRIEYGGNWSNIGRFTWVSNVTVDSADDEMYLQIQRGFPTHFQGRGGKHYRGFAILTGLSYPGGQDIFHDPGVEGEAYLEISTSGDNSNDIDANPATRNLPFGGLMLIAVAVIVGGIIMTARGGGKKKSYYEQYDKPSDEQELEPDWDRYYKR